jgi:hypothetical protein
MDSKGANWSECLSIPLAAAMDAEAWDCALREHLKSELQLSAYAPFHPINNNCFSFAMRFLNEIKFQGRQDKGMRTYYNW